MTIENRLRDAMRAVAEPIEPSLGEWDAVERRLRPARRGLTLVGGAGLAVAAAVIVGLLLRGDDDPERVRTLPATVPTTAVTPTSSSPQTTAVVPPPSFIVAARRDGSLQVLETTTGKTVRVLDRSTELHGVAVSSDGSTVYYAADDAIRRVGTAGGTPEVVVARTRSRPLALSPDDRHLAYVGRDALVVRELATGSERRWAFAAVDRVPQSVAWTLSGDRILYTEAFPEMPDQLFRLDLARVEPTLNVNHRPGGLILLGPSGDRPSGSGWYSASARYDGQIVVAEDCCSLDAGSYDGGSALLTIGTEYTGDVKSEMRVSLTGDLQHDGPRRHLLIVADGKVYRFANGRAVKVADDVVAADW